MNNAINMFEAKRKREKEEGSSAAEESFAEIAERNKKNAERLAKERAQANKNVLRSYRIKHK